MKLYGSPISPFVRKARIVAGELGLGDALTFIVTEGAPTDLDPGLRAKNPLRKIPFLELGDGQIVYDSRVICEALAAAAADPVKSEALLPPSGPSRFTVLTRQALADGICDAAVATAYERRLRPEDMVWERWVEAQLGKVWSGLDAAEQAVPGDGQAEDRFDLGDCALACVPPYLDLRFPDHPWRDGRPRLTAWWERVRGRRSVSATLED